DGDVAVGDHADQSVALADRQNAGIDLLHQLRRALDGVVGGDDTHVARHAFVHFHRIYSLLAGVIASSAVGAAELALGHTADRTGVVLNVAFDGVLAPGVVEVAAHRVRALRLADAGIAAQVAVEIGLRLAFWGHDALLPQPSVLLFPLARPAALAPPSGPSEAPAHGSA